jgi:hypothetical protein
VARHGAQVRVRHARAAQPWQKPSRDVGVPRAAAAREMHLEKVAVREEQLPGEPLRRQRGHARRDPVVAARAAPRPPRAISCSAELKGARARGQGRYAGSWEPSRGRKSPPAPTQSIASRQPRASSARSSARSSHHTPQLSRHVRATSPPACAIVSSTKWCCAACPLPGPPAQCTISAAPVAACARAADASTRSSCSRGSADTPIAPARAPLG